MITIYFLSGMHKHAILNFVRVNDLTILDMGRMCQTVIRKFFAVETNLCSEVKSPHMTSNTNQQVPKKKIYIYIYI